MNLFWCNDENLEVPLQQHPIELQCTRHEIICGPVLTEQTIGVRNQLVSVALPS